MREREKIATVKHLSLTSAPIEQIFAFLRKEKSTKVESVRLLHLGTRMSLGDAKKAVFRSRTWSDRLGSDEAFLDSLLQEESVPQNRKHEPASR